MGRFYPISHGGLNEISVLAGAFPTESSVTDDLLANCEWLARPVTDKFREKSAVVRMMREVSLIDP